jgi:hypothetical protein
MFVRPESFWISVSASAFCPAANVRSDGLPLNLGDFQGGHRRELRSILPGRSRLLLPAIDPVKCRGFAC